MDPVLALLILAWAAITLLYLGLAAVLREVRLLRRGLTAGQATGLGGTDLRLPESVTAKLAGPRTVLVADSGCPLCQFTATELARHADRPVLLTYEDRAAWPELPGSVELITDRDAWQGLAHLNPPMLLSVAADGRIDSLVLPTSAADVLRALRAPERQPS
ncbi:MULTISPECIES: hypothetical protein [unclassified Crossiella]|uniref:hypothetical protein n=1 Tax=unclassified Crossiella TaxID=2620835 RepID=UPI001FFEEC5F|nr:MULTISPECIES: hypothetical protein [unclassified Crossiella]MCK2238375.1 hypothetical protein [Crossiella sp. S99.2]MCK2256415.1 hypothetical protein [Crossiella sp. S99.1]